MKRDEIIAILKAGATDPPTAYITSDAWSGNYLVHGSGRTKLSSPQTDAVYPLCKTVALNRASRLRVRVHADCPLPDAHKIDAERTQKHAEEKAAAEKAKMDAYTGPAVALEIAQKAYHNDGYGHVTDLARDVAAILAVHGIKG